VKSEQTGTGADGRNDMFPIFCKITSTFH